MMQVMQKEHVEDKVNMRRARASAEGARHAQAANTDTHAPGPGALGPQQLKQLRVEASQAPLFILRQHRLTQAQPLRTGVPA